MIDSGSSNAHAEQKGFLLRRNGDSAEIQEPHSGGNGPWRSANKRGSANYSKTRLQFYRLENCAKNTDTLVVPGLSSSSGTTVLERSDGTAPGNWCDPSKTKNKNEKRDDSRDSGDRLRDLPEWLELEDTVMPVPAHSSRDSDSDRPTKVVSKLRKHSIKTHSHKRPNLRVCLRTKMTRAPCRRRTGKAVRAEQFDGLITDDHKVLNEGCESRDKSPIRCRGTRSYYSVDSILSV